MEQNKIQYIILFFILKLQHLNILSQYFEQIISTYIVCYFNIYSKNVELVYPKCRNSLFRVLNQLKTSVEVLKMVLQELELKNRKKETKRGIAPCSCWASGIHGGQRTKSTRGIYGFASPLLHVSLLACWLPVIGSSCSCALGTCDRRLPRPKSG